MIKTYAQQLADWSAQGYGLGMANFMASLMTAASNAQVPGKLDLSGVITAKPDFRLVDPVGSRISAGTEVQIRRDYQQWWLTT